jgi:hypothetical protein
MREYGLFKLEKCMRKRGVLKVEKDSSKGLAGGPTAGALAPAILFLSMNPMSDYFKFFFKNWIVSVHPC